MPYAHLKRRTPTRFAPFGATAFHFWPPRQYMRMDLGGATALVAVAVTSINLF